MTIDRWESLKENGVVSDSEEVFRLVYFGGVNHALRKEVWPYLLGHYKFGSTIEERTELDDTTRRYYETTMSEWLAVEAIVRQRDKEKTAHAVAKLSLESQNSDVKNKNLDPDGEIDNDVFEDNDISDLSDPEVDNTTDDTQTNTNTNKKEDFSLKTDSEKHELEHQDSLKTPTSPSDFENAEDVVNSGNNTNGVLSLNIQDDCFANKEEMSSNKSSPSTSSYVTVANDLQDFEEMKENRKIEPHAFIITDASIDVASLNLNAMEDEELISKDQMDLKSVPEEGHQTSLDALQEPRSACVSPASSNGGIYSVSLA